MLDVDNIVGGREGARKGQEKNGEMIKYSVVKFSRPFSARDSHSVACSPKLWLLPSLSPSFLLAASKTSRFIIFQTKVSNSCSAGFFCFFPNAQHFLSLLHFRLRYVIRNSKFSLFHPSILFLFTSAQRSIHSRPSAPGLELVRQPLHIYFYT